MIVNFIACLSLQCNVCLPIASKAKPDRYLDVFNASRGAYRSFKCIRIWCLRCLKLDSHKLPQYG